eukprot:TRINITY_DN61729_c0_g1_i1.p1 TRINITY_DN61729_c0_g1~~TRINITY_DN61729_c0_g1_i1.p1  ORF type:complete len:516 (+),score=80.84 TRINITY_DN61729_c0_g1_i1:78-1625(+)
MAVAFVTVAIAPVSQLPAVQPRASRAARITGKSKLRGAALVLALGSTRPWRRVQVRRVKSRVARQAQAASDHWEALEQEARGTSAGERLLQLQADREEGIVPHTDAKVRYFSDSREQPRVTIYRDQAAWCPYCQKVWLLLEEKRVDFAIEKVPMRSYGDKPDSFLRLIPRGILPAMEIDGRLMTESLDIMFTIENTFPDPERPMFPSSGALRERAAQLLRLERELFGAWCSYLFRPEMPLIGGSEDDFTSALETVDRELASNSESAFFLPYKHPTIVDMQYVSHVERAVASAMYYKGYDVRGRFPNIDRWLTAYEELPYYMASKSDYYTHCMDIPPQYGACFPNDSEMAQSARNFIDPGKARLPARWQSDLEPASAEQLRTPEEEFRIEAALSLIQNHEAVTRFCCRAAGGDVGDWARGNPTKCSLSDPYARPNEDFVPAVDAVLEKVAASLLQGEDAALQEVRAAVESFGGRSQQVAECIAYLRDRVGSPRDLSMPAAKLLRAHLGEAVCILSA